MENAPKVEETSSGTSALSAGFGGGPLDILDCLQDRPVADGAAVPEKCVRLKPVEYDRVPVRLPSGAKAWLDLPRPLTTADAAHLGAWIAQYIEDAKVETPNVMCTPNVVHNPE